jgi:hypothetical protein
VNGGNSMLQTAMIRQNGPVLALRMSSRRAVEFLDETP